MHYIFLDCTVIDDFFLICSFPYVSYVIFKVTRKLNKELRSNSETQPYSGEQGMKTAEC